MSVSSRIYVLFVKNFYHLDGYEVPTTPDPKTSISLWYQLQDAFDAVDEGKEQLEKEGYQLEFSWNGEYGDNIAYGCRMERGDGRSVVFEIVHKRIEGMPTGQQYII